jgi:uncharacterized membrane protein YphA (DoxX/SURF4 family)
MADEVKRNGQRSLLDLIMRLLCVYLAASFFFSGLQHWRDGELLQAGVNFSLVVAELGLIFGWHGHKSKVVRVLAWAGVIVAFIFLALSKIAK